MSPTEMEVRVARVICAEENPSCRLDHPYGYNCAGEFVPGGEGGETKPQAWMWFVPHARAAIRAMREPTEEMVEASFSAARTIRKRNDEMRARLGGLPAIDWSDDTLAHQHRAMIDAASPPRGGV